MGFDMHEVDRLAADLAVAPARVEAASVRVVHDVTHDTAHDASVFAPKRTGFLSENIEAHAEGLHGQVVSLADYSLFVEEGTSDTAPQPFMAPAASRNAPRLEDGIGDAGEDIL